MAEELLMNELDAKSKTLNEYKEKIDDLRVRVLSSPPHTRTLGRPWHIAFIAKNCFDTTVCASPCVYFVPRALRRICVAWPCVAVSVQFS